MDIDLLATDKQTLEDSLWVGLQESGVRVQLKRGDSQDPLAGFVRMSAANDRAVDLFVGRFSWQTSIIERTLPLFIQGLEVAVAEPADLVLLKLYAGGPQDRWDIQQLLAAQSSEELTELIDQRLAGLPRECADLWQDLRLI